jgi:predicted dithiol-disulfide oxidoreductase (DUF899 family)
VTAESIIGTRQDWLEARLRLLAREKAHTRESDEIARERRRLPWVPVVKPYLFETDDGVRPLSALFEGCSQLLVYHFMFGPDWEAGCPSCSLLADHFDGSLPHLRARDVALVCVSRAPYARLNAYKERMGWRFPWVSSLGSDFNFDFGVSFTPEQRATAATYNYATIEGPPEELPGLSSFALSDGVVHHVYSSYARGGDVLTGAYQLLDRTPRGRDEDALDWTMQWVRPHDRYDQEGHDGPVR